ncbi:hypothetical protein A2690_00300 [Candidatus Roizmanbacteria bacterium RIFCSPHIGHO2_01_FULL_39_12b]|uniref:Uncharacterized protein n=1 Tax=Candidatus Roizmanbacteria bacterium RIFCSPHIGHO2_01_FULL_39_12b TaxID=1802030 RepID=A0A1F7G8F5_9BACT|nr:MAG: hypothetical protein A2690_00300 [Candidatus Roizmanbacteria bacterium RIFCSPHIGHO2_01_FULL_39_12b]OGK46007.1 MAG: hypothetical protein A3B46_00590 [Candidatus Roizmanbacteria bacterium RIFCSPLOWO2_01_FULL_39_19]
MVSGVVLAAVNDWGDCVVDGVPTLKCLEVVIGNIIFISSTVAILVLFAMLIVGGIRFIWSGGNADKLKVARGTLTYAFIGLLFFVGAYLLLSIVDVLFLGGQGRIFRFEIPEL